MLASFARLPREKSSSVSSFPAVLVSPAPSPADVPRVPSICPAFSQIATFSLWYLLSNEITASMPASPAIDTPSVKPPVASIGMVGISIPKVFPPTIGTQSGIVTLILFSAPIALLIRPITALIGAFTIATRPSQRPPNTCTIPFHAWLQFPENTPVMKSIKP